MEMFSLNPPPLLSLELFTKRMLNGRLARVAKQSFENLSWLSWLTEAIRTTDEAGMEATQGEGGASTEAPRVRVPKTLVTVYSPQEVATSTTAVSPATCAYFIRRRLT